MKAPEKLYLPKRNKLPLEVVRGGKWYETDPQCMYGNIEYTRTDAFIEKACEWLEDNMMKWFKNMNTHGYKMTGLMIEDFKKAMKL